MPECVETYLLPTPGMFWRWTEGGNVAEWLDGTTIAYREELIPILDRLADDGLPPLPSVLLFVAACRDSWRSNQRPYFADQIRKSLCSSDVDVPINVYLVLGESIIGLDSLSQAVAKHPILARRLDLLAEIVFELSAESRTSTNAGHVIRLLEMGLGEAFVEPLECQVPGATTYDEMCQTLQSLSSFEVDVNRYRTRLATGLDELPDADSIDLKIPPSQRARQLLEELKDDDELSGLARLSQQLMAAVTLPRALADEDQMPVGGFSDISNRGPLDRLLLSELANDDMTLAVRVAMNEAMYLRRESLPKPPNRRRSILLDAGIRTWGVPRVFATAAALAIVATTRDSYQLATYRAKANRIEPVDLTTRDGLMEHLAALETDIHPGAALDAFRREDDATEDVDDFEPIVITTEDTAADLSFQRAVSQSGFESMYLLTVNRDGRIRLRERNARGVRDIRDAQISLDALFNSATNNKDKAPAKRLLREEAGREQLPAIFRVHPFPLRLPHPLRPNNAWEYEDRGLLAISHDRRLMAWTTRGCGAVQIADDLPKGKLIWASGRATTFVDGREVTYALIGTPQPYLLEIDVNDQSCVATPIEFNGQPKGVAEHHGALFLYFRRTCYVFRLADGSLIQTVQIGKGFRWLSGRYFLRQNTDLVAMCFDGQAVRFEELGTFQSDVLHVWESDVGLIGATSKSWFFESPDGPAIRFAPELDQLMAYRSSWNMRRLVVDTEPILLPGVRFERIERYVISTDEPKSGAADFTSVRLPVAVESSGSKVPTIYVRHAGYGCVCTHAENVDAYVYSQSLRVRFDKVGVDRSTWTLLLYSKNYPLQLSWNENGKRMEWSHPSSTRLGPVVSLETYRPVHSIGPKLKRAVWADGSQAVLDSRGLLHLKSSDVSIPELTLVLKQDFVAGWCSDGRVFGEPYFTGRPDSAPDVAKSIFENVMQPFARRLK